MRYSEEFLEYIRQSIRVETVIAKYVKLSKYGDFLIGLCPFHEEKEPSFVVSLEDNIWYCLGCGKGGDALQFIIEYNKCSIDNAVNFLCQEFNIKSISSNDTENLMKYKNRQNVLAIINLYAQKYFKTVYNSSSGEPARKYFKNRQLSDETIAKWGLGYSDDSKNGLYLYLKKSGFSDDAIKESGLISFHEKGIYDKFFKRVMFPIKDINGRIIGFGGRILGTGDCKYLNSPETMLFSKSNNLFGFNFAKNSGFDYMILCEGFMDVISLHQAGFTNATASLGTSLTSEQCEILSHYTKLIYLTYDSDGPGIHAAERAVPMLNRVGIAVRVINMKPAKDPDEFIKTFGSDAFKTRISEAPTALDWMLQTTKERFDMYDPAQNDECIRDVTDLLLKYL